MSLGPNGEVRAARFNGHVVVMVTADELDLGVNQTVLVHCEVCELCYVWICIINIAYI